MLLQLGHMEDIMDLFEPALKVKSVCFLSYALYYPEWSYISRPKLPTTCKMEGLRGEWRFFAFQVLLQPVMLVKVALLVVLRSLQVVLGVLDYLPDVMSEVASGILPWLPTITSTGNLTWSPYTNSNGERPVLSTIVELMANST